MIILGPSLTDLKGTQVTGSIIHTLVSSPSCRPEARATNIGGEVVDSRSKACKMIVDSVEPKSPLYLSRVDGEMRARNYLNTISFLS
jgi:hypothetical protein